MKQLSTLLSTLCFITLFFSSCGEKDQVEPENCNVVKEYLLSSGSRQLLNLYEYDASGKILKIIHQDVPGSPTETRFEYDGEGRLVKLFDKFSLGTAGVPFDGVLEYQYSARGVVYQVDGFKIENEKKDLFQSFVLYYVPDTKQINQIITSFGERYRFEYDAKGNALKTLYQPLSAPEYVLEEYNGYSAEVLNDQNYQPFLLRNIFFALRGSSFSQNQVTSFNTYNQDSSLKATQTIERVLNTEGKLIKETTTINANGTTTSRTTEKEYPACK